MDDLALGRDGFPAKCTRMNDEGQLPTCTQVGDEWRVDYPGSGLPGESAFALLFVLVLVVGGLGIVWKVSTARRLARDAGMDEDDATRMALFTNEGLEATYLASSLRQPLQPAEAVPAAAAPRSTEERLRELESLRTQELISEEEYAERRRAVLDQL